MSRLAPMTLILLLLPLLACSACSDDPGSTQGRDADVQGGGADAAGDATDIRDGSDIRDATGDASDTSDASDTNDVFDDTSDARDDAEDTSDAAEDSGLTCDDPSEEPCDGQCVDTTSSVEHCGACDSACPQPENTVAACATSSCELSCEAGFFDANDDLSDEEEGDGCECSQTNGGDEICDGLDNDCDGEVDEGCDTDGDGYCAEGLTVESGATCQPGDCDDTDAAISPGAAPACNGVDTNCDGTADNLLARQSVQQSFTFNGSDNSPRAYPSPVLATSAGTGFCVAALDESAGTLEFAHIETGGQTSTHSSNVPTNTTVDLLDLEWDGADCTALFREGPNSLNLRRWTPGDSATVTLEVSSELSGNDSWETVRNAALWFGTVSRCSNGTCTPAPRWVVVYVKEIPSVSDNVVFNTVPKAFSATETLLPEIVLDTSAPVNGNVDVVGTGTPGDGFLALDKTSNNLTTIYEVVAEQITYRDDLSVDDSYNNRPMINFADGSLFMQRRRQATSTLRQTRLSVITDNGFGVGGFANSSFAYDYLGRDFVWPIDGVEHFYMDGYSDKAFHAYETGSGTTYYDFDELTHPNFGSFNELLAPNRQDGSFWLARLTDDAPYTVALDAFGCF